MSVYKYPSSDEQIRQESQTYLEIERFNNEGVPLIYIKGASFPLQTYTENLNESPKILFASNIVKSIIIDSIKLLASPIYIVPTLYTLYFNLESMLERFNRIASKVISPYILKDAHKDNFIKEIEYLIFIFLYNLKIKEEIAERTAEILGHIINTDDAYSLRIKDLITSVGSLEPKYIKEYIRLSIERDDHVVSKKFKLLGTLARIALIVPKLRNAWGKAIKTIDISNLMLNDASTYWSGFKTGYKFQGRTQEENRQVGITKGWTYPDMLQ